MSSPENQNHFVVMVKECIDSQYALQVMQLIAQGEKKIEDLISNIPEADEAEINRIIEKVTQYTLVTASQSVADALTLTDTGREFLSILSDIERLKLRYQN